MMGRFDASGDASMDRMRESFNPAHVDQQICRMVDRALRDLRDDSAAFGIQAK